MKNYTDVTDQKVKLCKVNQDMKQFRIKIMKSILNTALRREATLTTHTLLIRYTKKPEPQAGSLGFRVHLHFVEI